MRGALHAHILAWFCLRDQRAKPANYQQLASVKRSSTAVTESKQRPRSHVVEPLPAGEYQEDNVLTNRLPNPIC